MRSAARNNRPVIGSVEQRASTSPLAEVRYSGRLIRRCGNTISIMKSAVCSMSSTASRKPPSVILGTPVVAARPAGLTRRSSILPALLTRHGGWAEFVDDDACELALRAAEGCNDLFHGIVDVE